MKFWLIVLATAITITANQRVVIPAGNGTVGADMNDITLVLEGTDAQPEWYADEAPKRTIQVASFLIDKLEVTNERYGLTVTTHQFPPNLATHPVVNITYAEAVSFCEQNGGRLPTEAEWERAARGDDGRLYPWGNTFETERAVYVGAGAGAQLKVGSHAIEQSSSQALGGTRPAGSIPAGASPFGLLDMAGNVWEWVEGYYDEKKGLRLLKGGSWLTPPMSLRSSTRLGDPGVKRYNDFGFRCAYDLE
jgi:formylglycine-generating enzyme required for sulfatase activity